MSFHSVKLWGRYQIHYTRPENRLRPMRHGAACIADGLIMVLSLGRLHSNFALEQTFKALDELADRHR